MPNAVRHLSIVPPAQIVRPRADKAPLWAHVLTWLFGVACGLMAAALAWSLG